MLDLEFLERLIQAIDESSLDSIEIERGGTRVRLAKTPPQHVSAPAAPTPLPAAAHAPAPAPSAGGSAESTAPTGGEEEGGAEAGSGNLVDITSPMVGTFYRAPAPDAPPYVDTGSSVSQGDTLCIIEAMKLMNELESEVSGKIVEILVENAQPVEYGQVLFRLDPA